MPEGTEVRAGVGPRRSLPCRGWRERAGPRRAEAAPWARALVTRGPDMSDLPVTLRPWMTERSGSPAKNQVARGRTASAASLTATYPFGYTKHARAEVLRDRRWPQRARGVHLSIAGTHARSRAGRHRGLPAVWREGADLLETDLGSRPMMEIRVGSQRIYCVVQVNVLWVLQVGPKAHQSRDIAKATVRMKLVRGQRTQ